MSAENRVAMVTGGSQGIGLEIARSLAEAGHDVVVTARRADVLADAVEVLRSEFGDRGRGILGVAGDVADRDAVEESFDAAIREFGAAPRTLVNCAGIGTLHRLLDLPVEDWENIFDVHVKGTFLTTQAFGRRLREEGAGGSIINITSLNHNVATAGIAHYCAAKAAVTQFTQASAIELAPFGIRVNSVAPGAVLTPMMEPYLSPAMREGYLSRTPLGRLGAPLDIARVVTFLASEQSGWITGAAIPVDGGAHMMGLHNYADAVGLP